MNAKTKQIKALLKRLNNVNLRLPTSQLGVIKKLDDIIRRRTCPICFREFMPTHNRQIFDTSECARTATNKRHLAFYHKTKKLKRGIK
jgi:hypothetical protein